MGITVTACKHRAGYADWIRNDGTGAPVLMLETFSMGPVLLTLTNQTIFMNCPGCFEATRRDALSRCSPGS